MIRGISVGLRLAVVACVTIPSKTAPKSAAGEKTSKHTRTSCPVTPPDRLAPTNEGSSVFQGWISDRKPALRVGLWPDGTVVFTPGGPGSTEPDGSLSMKFPWWREGGIRGKLRIHGRRLDALAPPLRAAIPDGYADTGFQSAALIFPTEGCWEVTGEVADTRLTFVPE